MRGGRPEVIDEPRVWADRMHGDSPLDEDLFVAVLRDASLRDPRDGYLSARRRCRATVRSRLAVATRDASLLERGDASRGLASSPGPRDGFSGRGAGRIGVGGPDGLRAGMPAVSGPRGV